MGLYHELSILSLAQPDDVAAAKKTSGAKELGQQGLPAASTSPQYSNTCCTALCGLPLLFCSQCTPFVISHVEPPST